MKLWNDKTIKHTKDFSEEHNFIEENVYGALNSTEHFWWIASLICEIQEINDIINI